MYLLLKKLLLTITVLACVACNTDNGSWQPVELDATHNTGQSYFTTDEQLLRDRLMNAPMESSGDNSYTISLPMPDGQLSRFSVVESPIMAVGLAAKYPQLRTFKIFGIDDPTASGRADITPRGFHAMVHTAGGRVTIDPDNGRYRVQNRNPGSNKSFRCSTGQIVSFDDEHQHDSLSLSGRPVAYRVNNNYMVYELAVSATKEYVDAIDGTLGGSMAEIVTAINRVNDIYERDLGIRLQLVANNDLLIDVNNVAGFNNNDLIDLIAQNQAWVDSQIGSANYDIGHVFSTTTGGLANVSSICAGFFKARGATGLGTPNRETFYIDYVAHELGHQFGAEHSFNGTTGSCSAGRVASSAWEPGSGSSIMAYAGICGSENIQLSTDANFHSGSIEQIHSLVSTRNCHDLVSANNPAEPTANAGSDYIIPRSTAFQLRGTGNDTDPFDRLTYQWDQRNAGTASFGTDIGNNALFRSYLPQPAGDRDFPALGTQLCGRTDRSEVLPTTSRTLEFTLTVRDGKSGQGVDSALLTVDSGSGPFAITSHNIPASITPSAGPVNLTWDVAGTASAPVSCSSVNIDLLTFSSDHASYSVTSLVSSVPNDGAHSVTLPDMANSLGRFRVKCSNNIFYDMSNADLDILGSGGAFPVGNITTFFNVKGSAFSGTSSCSASSDNIAPVITILGTTPVNINLGETYTDAGATAQDNYDSDITHRIIPLNTVDTSKNGTYTVTYNVKDAAGNDAIPVIRTVIVGTPADNTPPVITLLGNNPDSLVVGNSYTDPGATASDNIDGNISVSITSSGSVNTNQVGTYLISYNVSDFAGNEAITVTRTVHVISASADTTPPVITLLGNNPDSLVVGNSYTDPGATASDNIDGNISVSITSSGSVNTNQVGTYLISYDVSDFAGNEAITVTRTVHVVSAPADPIETTNGSADAGKSGGGGQITSTTLLIFLLILLASCLHRSKSQ